MKIKNFQNLALTKTRKDALKIAEAGLEAIDTQKIIKEKIQLKKNSLVIDQKTFSLKGVKNIYVVAIGKCAGEASLALEKVLDKKIKAGIALDVKKVTGLKIIRSLAGSHPLPSRRNTAASLQIINLIKNLAEDDLIIFLISGGGSSLLCVPKSGTCEEETLIDQKLMASGATIDEMNTVRKHLSQARGGYLAKYAYPAKSIALIFSDVVGNDLEFISSGPTVKDATTVRDALQILNKYNIQKVCSIKNCGLIETPKNDEFFKKVSNLIFVSNEVALKAMAKTAKKLGYRVKICTSCLKGEARNEGAKIAAEINRAKPKTVLLYGGETTVNVKGKGKGGRNMELALGALSRIQKGSLVLSFASDGIDNTPLAGAICDKMTKEKAEKLKLKPISYLAENNSYPFFKKTGDYLLTGQTGSNVSDLVIAIKE
ncbi:MAG: DUF4147 domain-containing protein [Candidatus Liptonbacteria bacterium]|nr:DUF4147 domain-containing protein [Candidatus Liptonbacteria bacterium]